jgi:hypothetical protein
MHISDSTYKQIRREAFLKLAEKRVTKALKALESVSKLSDSKNYVYTEEDVKQLLDAIKSQVEKLEQAFDAEVGEEVIFKFNK